MWVKVYIQMTTLCTICKMPNMNVNIPLLVTIIC